MQNVLKRKNMYFDEKFAKYVHLDLFYLLVYSGSFDMHKKNYKKEIICFLKSAKHRLLPYGGGGSVMDWCATFFHAFP